MARASARVSATPRTDAGRREGARRGREGLIPPLDEDHVAVGLVVAFGIIAVLSRRLSREVGVIVHGLAAMKRDRPARRWPARPSATSATGTRRSSSDQAFRW